MNTTVSLKGVPLGRSNKGVIVRLIVFICSFTTPLGHSMAANNVSTVPKSPLVGSETTPSILYAGWRSSTFPPKRLKASPSPNGGSDRVLFRFTDDGIVTISPPDRAVSTVVYRFWFTTS